MLMLTKRALFALHNLLALAVDLEWQECKSKNTLMHKCKHVHTPPTHSHTFTHTHTTTHTSVLSTSRACSIHKSTPIHATTSTMHTKHYTQSRTPEAAPQPTHRGLAPNAAEILQSEYSATRPLTRRALAPSGEVALQPLVGHATLQGEGREQGEHWDVNGCT